MPLVMGVDVAGSKKGFHTALASTDQIEIIAVGSHLTGPDVIRLVQTYRPQIVAIDCPPKAQIQGPLTRLSERQLNKIGVKVQYTRRPTHEPQEWMVNGQELWDNLARFCPESTLIETFPTVVARALQDCPLALPFQFLQGDPRHREGYKDLLDASLCAWTAIKYLQGTAQSVGHDPLTGEQDELGPIFF